MMRSASRPAEVKDKSATRASGGLRPTLTQRLGLSLSGLMLVAVVIGGLALVSSMGSHEFYEDLWAEQLVQARAIYEVEVSVLELGNRMTGHLLGLEPQGPSPEVTFEISKRKLLETELEPDQRRLLPEIERAFLANAALWPRVLAYDPSAEDGEELRRLVDDLTAVHGSIRKLCTRLREANERDLRAALAAERAERRRVSYWIVTFSGLLVGLALAITWLFWHRTLRPLQRILGRLRRETASRRPVAGAGELEELEACVIEVAEEIASMRTRVSHSDRYLLESDKLATLGKIAAGVAHEIRSPLTALRMRLFSLQRRIRVVDPDQLDNVRVMEDEMTRLDGIVSSFLELSQPPRVVPKPCSLSLLTDKTLEVLRHRIDASGLRIDRVEEPDLPPVLADPPQLRQVIMNLLNNAIEAVPSGGRIYIEAARDSTAAERPLLLLRIADEGGGVPEEILDNLFVPFSSTKTEGAGLGLWIARNIAIRHGGSLVLERTSAAGAVFALRVPVAQEGGGHGSNPGD